MRAFIDTLRSSAGHPVMLELRWRWTRFGDKLEVVWPGITVGLATVAITLFLAQV